VTRKRPPRGRRDSGTGRCYGPGGVAGTAGLPTCFVGAVDSRLVWPRGFGSV